MTIFPYYQEGYFAHMKVTIDGTPIRLTRFGTTRMEAIESMLLHLEVNNLVAYEV